MHDPANVFPRETLLRGPRSPTDAANLGAGRPYGLTRYLIEGKGRTLRSSTTVEDCEETYPELSSKEPKEALPPRLLWVLRRDSDRSFICW